jgi:hypothetical protein
VNIPDHFFRQAANCARDGTFVKGVDTAKELNNKSTLALPLTKVSARAYLWLDGEMVFPYTKHFFVKLYW